MVTKYFKNLINTLFIVFSKASIESNVYIHPKSKLNKYVKIGNNTRINGPCFILGTVDEHVSIGKYCAVGYNLRIRTRNHSVVYANLQDKLQHDISAPSLTSTKGNIQIGNGVWIGDNVTILSGVKVGHGAVIGACSLVTKNVAPFSINVGVPSKSIRERFTNEVQDFLLEINWWEWSREKILLNKDFFSINLNEIRDINYIRSVIRDV